MCTRPRQHKTASLHFYWLLHTYANQQTDEVMNMDKTRTEPARLAMPSTER